MIAGLSETYPIHALPPAQDIRNVEGDYDTRVKGVRPAVSIAPFEVDKRDLARTVAVGGPLRVDGLPVGSALVLRLLVGEIGPARLTASGGSDLGLHRISVPGADLVSIAAISEDDSLLAVATKRSVLVYEVPSGLQVC